MNSNCIQVVKILIFCILLIASACSSKKETSAETGDDSIKVDSIVTTEVKKKLKDGPIKITFPLDSLLSFDSEAELKKAFGDENVIRSIGYLGEGEGTFPTTTLFQETRNAVVFEWKDTVKFDKLWLIHLRGKESDWQTRDGIKLGTKLTELEILNQKPFTFLGFGWDYSGVVDWKDGYLTGRVGVDLDCYQQTKDCLDLSGDTEFTSDSELARKANPIVVRVGLSRQNYVK